MKSLQSAVFSPQAANQYTNFKIKTIVYLQFTLDTPLSHPQYNPNSQRKPAIKT